MLLAATTIFLIMAWLLDFFLINLSSKVKQIRLIAAWEPLVVYTGYCRSSKGYIVGKVGKI